MEVTVCILAMLGLEIFNGDYSPRPEVQTGFIPEKSRFKKRIPSHDEALIMKYKFSPSYDHQV